MSSNFNPAKFLILGFKGTAPPDGFLNLIKAFQPGGFVFLADNYENPDQFCNLTKILRDISPESFIYSIDQEPGRVQRFKNGFPISLTPEEYSKNYSYSEFREWCSETVSLLYDIGINLNFAPVVDLIGFDSDFPVLNKRAFGNDPEIVSRFSKILIEEHKKKNLFTCAKHFPGLGQGNIDPHENIVNSDLSLEELQNHHWLPFQNAVKDDVDFIMTTHLKNSNIDEENIATFSNKTIEIIRNQIGFNGLVISDDLLMGGAGQNENIGSASVKTLKAGHNLIMISRDLDLQRQAICAISDLYEKDAEFKTVVDKNETKIDKFKKQAFKYINNPQ